MKTLLITILVFISFGLAHEAHGAALIDYSEDVTISLKAGVASLSTTTAHTYDLTRTTLFFLGWQANTTAGNIDDAIANFECMTDPDSVTLSRSDLGTAGTTTASARIVEWASGVTTSVQCYTINTFPRGIGYFPVTLSPAVVASSTIATWTGVNSTSTVGAGNIDRVMGKCSTGDSTTGYLHKGGDSLRNATTTCYFTEFASGIFDSIQQVEVTVGGNGVLTADVTISSVTLNDTSIIFCGYRPNSGTGASGFLIQSELIDATTIRGTRLGHISTGRLCVNAVDWNSSYLAQNAQRGEIIMNAGVSTQLNSVTSVDRTKSLLSMGGWMGTSTQASFMIGFEMLTNDAIHSFRLNSAATATTTWSRTVRALILASMRGISSRSASRK